MRKYSYHHYGIMQSGGKFKDGKTWNGWIYYIYTDNPDYKYYENTNLLLESDEYYETAFEAVIEARDCIDRLESGECR